LVNVHIEDMKCGVHEHLMFGDGEIDFPPVIHALRETNFAGGIHVELSRHSHMAPQAAQQAYDFLTSLIQ
jgi:sugar phosphate isomerase/epimerase